MMATASTVLKLGPWSRPLTPQQERLLNHVLLAALAKGWDCSLLRADHTKTSPIIAVTVYVPAGEAVPFPGPREAAEVAA